MGPIRTGKSSTRCRSCTRDSDPSVRAAPGPDAPRGRSGQRIGSRCLATSEPGASDLVGAYPSAASGNPGSERTQISSPVDRQDRVVLVPGRRIGQLERGSRDVLEHPDSPRSNRVAGERLARHVDVVAHHGGRTSVESVPTAVQERTTVDDGEPRLTRSVRIPLGSWFPRPPTLPSTSTARTR